MKILSKFAAAAVVAISMTGAAQAATLVDVAFSGGTGSNQIAWDGTSPGQGTLTVNNILTHLDFDDAVYNDGGGQDAYLTLFGSTYGGGTLEVVGNNFIQTGLDGYFEFRTAANVLLLRGDFTDYWISGAYNFTTGVGGRAGNFAPADDGSVGGLQLTSGVVDLSYIYDDNAQFGFTNVHFGNTNGFKITGTGANRNLEDFSGNNLTGSFAGAVPEPATWALMILGFGGAGAMLRRRRVAFA